MVAAGPEALADSLIAGDRRALARAITLIESTKAEDRARAEALVERLAPRAGSALRIAISGAPGVGKSTFIEAFGLHAVSQGRRVAVLAVDPSSPRSGGALLGDKTRMVELARTEGAFIRPSPSRGTLGGVHRRTRESILACEAAGFDLILVETVGVGQSETEAAGMVDAFLLLLAPGAGDELQGLKRGIVELADVVAVNKDDGELAAAARRMQSEYRAALHLLRPMHAEWQVPVLRCSALERKGIDSVWSATLRHCAAMEASGAFAARRAGQSKDWLWSELREGLVERFLADSRLKSRLARAEAKVAEGAIAPTAAARDLLAGFGKIGRGS